MMFDSMPRGTEASSLARTCYEDCGMKAEEEQGGLASIILESNDPSQRRDQDTKPHHHVDNVYLSFPSSGAGCRIFISGRPASALCSTVTVEVSGRPHDCYECTVLSTVNSPQLVR